MTRPGGVVVLSTPNRVTFSPGLGRREKPSNLYHCREYDARELAGELGAGCPAQASRWSGLGHGERLSRWEREHGSVVAAQQDQPAEDWDGALQRGRQVRDGRRLRLRRRGRRLSGPVRRRAAARPPRLGETGRRRGDGSAVVGGASPGLELAPALLGLDPPPLRTLGGPGGPTRRRVRRGCLAQHGDQPLPGDHAVLSLRAVLGGDDDHPATDELGGEAGRGAAPGPRRAGPPPRATCSGRSRARRGCRSC